MDKGQRGRGENSTKRTGSEFAARMYFDSAGRLSLLTTLRNDSKYEAIIKIFKPLKDDESDVGCCGDYV